MMNTLLPMLMRMRYINRWGLMHSTQSESLSQHSFECALLTHMLAIIGNSELGKCYDPEKLCTYAIYHDATETLTGDMPTPIKYYTPEMRDTYRIIEEAAVEKLVSYLPQSLRNAYFPYLSGDGLSDDEKLLLKAADRLCAYIKCIAEVNAGNGEFSVAYTATKQSVEAMPLPEVKYFIEHCLGAFSLPLDELGGAL